ncbi:MAG: glycosyltransferase [Thermoguttaceae bacterium]|nr:glycosyltransferase [Thermoguttaceae bacterium]MBQ6620630.1 glycosyltransferase [Thermoguttaceae bacterium]
MSETTDGARRSPGAYPRVTVLLAAYNEEKYVQQAIEPLLAQQYQGELEIILSDDRSPDHTFEVMRRVASEYRGPHTVVLNQNPTNLGILGHFDYVARKLVHGDIIVFHGGDDIARPGYIQTVADAFLEHPECVYASFAFTPINEVGEVIGPSSAGLGTGIQRFTRSDYFAGRFGWSGGPASAFRREVISRFASPAPNRGAYQESLILYRSLCLGEVCFFKKDVIFYRRHNRSVSVSFKPQNRPELMEGVYRQAHTDVDRALEEHLLSEEEAALFHRSVDREDHFNRLRRLYESRGFLGKQGVLLRTLFSSQINLRQKLSFIWNRIPGLAAVRSAVRRAVRSAVSRAMHGRK